MEENRPSHREKNVKMIILTGMAVILAVMLVFSYGYGVVYFRDHFLPNTVIDGINVGEMTAEEAAESLSEAFSVKEITVNGRNSVSETLDVSQAGIYREYSGLEKCLNEQNRMLWLYAGFRKNGPRVSYEYGCDEEMLVSLAGKLRQLDDTETEAPVNAYINTDAGSGICSVVPETEGNTVDKEEFYKILIDAAENGIGVIDLEKSGCYLSPVIRADDEELRLKAECMNLLETRAVNLDLGAYTGEVIHGYKLLELLGGHAFTEAVKNGGQAAVDRKALDAFISSLSEKYNTRAQDEQKTFTSWSGRQVVIECDYGWKLDEEKTEKVLEDRLTEIGSSVINEERNTVAEDAGVNEDDAAAADAGESPESGNGGVKAVWTSTAATHGTNDIGDFYAEVDLTAQTVYIIDHNNCIFTSPCVSGRMSGGRGTPAGIYSISYKQLHRVLRGYNSNGTLAYASPVTYWMPFNKGIGFHDATWRDSFGGNIYINSGSHGCVNLPYSKAKEMYDLVYVGMPVVLYY